MSGLLKKYRIAKKLFEAGFRLEADGNIVARGAENFRPALDVVSTINIPRGSSALNGYAVWLHQPLPEDLVEMMRNLGAVAEVAE